MAKDKDKPKADPKPQAPLAEADAGSFGPSPLGQLLDQQILAGYESARPTAEVGLTGADALEARVAQLEAAHAAKDAELVEVRAMAARLDAAKAQAEDRLGRGEAENDRLRAELAAARTVVVAPLGTADTPVVPAGPRRARVRVPDTHLPAVEVLVPEGAANPEAAAIRLAKERLGVWAFGAGPVVEWLD